MYQFLSILLKKQLSAFLIMLCVISTAYAKPEVIPNKPINAAQAQALNKLSGTSDLGKLKTTNKNLITENAMLVQENNALQTQVNVLVAERSNQIFMTGAFVTIGGIFLGFIAAWLLIGRRNNNDW